MTCSFGTTETVGFKLPEGKSGAFNLSNVKIGGQTFPCIVFRDDFGIEEPVSEHFSFSTGIFESARERLRIEILLSEANDGLRRLGKYKPVRRASREPV